MSSPWHRLAREALVAFLVMLVALSGLAQARVSLGHASVGNAPLALAGLTLCQPGRHGGTEGRNGQEQPAHSGKVACDHCILCGLSLITPPLLVALAAPDRAKIFHFPVLAPSALTLIHEWPWPTGPPRQV